MNYKTYKAWQLALLLLRHPTYQILLGADSVLPPSPWTDEFRVVVNHVHKTINITGDLT